MISASRLYYYGARYYDPKSAVFLGVDPLSDKYPGWSGFTYCLDNPIKFIDETGGSPQKPIKGNNNSTLSNWLQAEAESKSAPPGPYNPHPIEGYDFIPFGNGSGRIEPAPVLDVLSELAALAISEGLEYIGLNRKAACVTATAGVFVISALRGNPKLIIRNIDDLIKAAGKLKNQSGGKISQDPIKGNIDDIFTQITQGGTKTGSDLVKMPDGTFVRKYNGDHGPTIHINKPDESKPIKIRISDEE